MDEILNLVSTFIPDEVIGSLGLDAAMVGAVHEGTNRVKEYLETVSWDDKFARLYVIIPFIVAFPMTWLQAGMPTTLALLGSVAFKAGMYWVLATTGWNIYKKGLKGE